MPIEVRVSDEFQSKCGAKDWFNAPYREGYAVVSSGRALMAHPANTDTKRIPGLTNGQKILQNLTLSDLTLKHPGWTVNKQLIEDHIGTGLQDIREIIVENVLIKSTAGSTLYILQISIDLTLDASLKLNKMDSILASFILDSSLNLQRRLPLIITCKNELYLGINEPEVNDKDDSSEANLKKIMFNLSNSNQLSHLPSVCKNKRLLEEAISADLHENQNNANIHDISLISIEKIWIEESNAEEQQIIDVKIETNLTRTPISASFVLTSDFNLAKHFVNAAHLLHIEEHAESQQQEEAPEEGDNKKCQPIAEFINATFKGYVAPQPVKAGKSEKPIVSFISDEDELELPDYDRVIAGQVTPVENLAEKHGIEWAGKNRLPFFASLSIQTPVSLEYSSKSKTPELNSEGSNAVNNSIHGGKTFGASPGKKP